MVWVGGSVADRRLLGTHVRERRGASGRCAARRLRVHVELELGSDIDDSDVVVDSID
jgi:hypothetical protein